MSNAQDATTRTPDRVDLFTGYSIIGDLNTNFPIILSGECDYELKVCSYHTIYKKMPENNDFLEDKEVIAHIEKLKKFLNIGVNIELRKIEREEAIREKRNKKIQDIERRKKFQETQKPSEFGTVSEIAEKYGLSKKQVRKMKQNGQLEEYIQNH